MIISVRELTHQEGIEKMRQKGGIKEEELEITC